MAGFFKRSGEKILFSGPGEIIYYIPEKYFDLSVANFIGETIELFGIFTYGLYGANSKQIKLDRFKCPTVIQCRPSYINKDILQLIGSKEEQAYRLLHFKDGDELISNINVAKDTVNVEKFVKLLTGGNLPDNIPYNELHEYVIENAQLNGFKYKVSPQIIGVIISELCRDTKDLIKPFRLSNSDDMLNYKFVSIKNIPRYTSPYTAITSENADEAVAAALITKGNEESPLEKVMMN